MNETKHFSVIFAVLSASLSLLTSVHGQALSRLSSRFLVRGEQALLEVCVTGGQPTALPVMPVVAGVEIRQTVQGTHTRLLPGRQLEHVFEYLVSSYSVGNHVLPSFDVVANGVTARTEPLEFSVFNPDDLKWSETNAGDLKIRYASAFRVMNARTYDGQSLPVEIKIFVPRDLFVEDWGIPNFQRDGLTSWRFQPSAMRGQVNLLGHPYVSVAYPSTLAATRTGKITIGPATIRLMTTQVVMDGILKRISQEVNLTVQALELESMPLPKGAPDGFDNAIGSFKLDVSTALTEVQEGDPIPVDIVVSGSGNLDTLHPPKPAATGGWKLYDATTDQRGEERRELSGKTVFHQFMRPLELKPAVPSFRLVYFDPADATYNTLLSEPIPLHMTPALSRAVDTIAPPGAAAIPLERMTDILGVLRVASGPAPKPSPLAAWWGHALGGLIAIGLIAKAWWLRFGHRFKTDPLRNARVLELRQIARVARSNDVEFLMLAGSFIERWHGENASPAIHGILAERDASCFQKTKPEGFLLSPKRRVAILKLLRKSAVIMVAALLLGSLAGQARAGDSSVKGMEAYDSARYDEAIKIWLQGSAYTDLTADALFNIGNACYRSGSPGYAALYYRRALARDPVHQESLQNLRFIERKCGAITFHRPDYQNAIARFPLTAWQALCWTGVWLSGLAALVFPATRAGARLRIAAIAACFIGPMLAVCGGLGWRCFPNDSEFAIPERQAVIVGEKAVLHVDAARTSPEVIDAPAGSLCEVIGESGHWVYVAFATKTRGWIPMEWIEKVVPITPPAPPVIRKPKANEKSA